MQTEMRVGIFLRRFEKVRRATLGDTEKSEDAVEGAGAAPIVISPQCSLREIEEFLDGMASLPDGAEIVIDASEIEQMTSACALAVVSAIRQQEALSKKIAVISPATAFVDAFSELGLFADLMNMEFRQ